MKGTCQNGKDFSTYSNEVCLCPPAADLGTCNCALSTGSTTTVSVDCSGKQLNDSAVATLVNTISWAPIDTLNLSGNNMTKIPSGLGALKQLSSLSVEANQIASIGAADLSSLVAAVKRLNFASNSISTIAAGSFPGQFANLCLNLVYFKNFISSFSCLIFCSAIRLRGKDNFGFESSDVTDARRL